MLETYNSVENTVFLMIISVRSDISGLIQMKVCYPWVSTGMLHILVFRGTSRLTYLTGSQHMVEQLNTFTSCSVSPVLGLSIHQFANNNNKKQWADSIDLWKF